MRYLFFGVLMICIPICTMAQKHYAYADVGYTPGFSVTYNYSLAKRLGAGAGFQAYNMFRTDASTRKFTPTIYGDIRLNIRPEKNNQFFTFMDLGINIYKQDKSYTRDSTMIAHYPHNNGFNLGIGIGYLRRMTKRGGGLYISLKAMANIHTLYGYSIIAEEENIGLLAADIPLAISFGFKF